MLTYVQMYMYVDVCMYVDTNMSHTKTFFNRNDDKKFIFIQRR